MAQIKKIFHLILFNVGLSGLTTLLVLWYWDTRQPAVQAPAVTALTVVVAAPQSGTPFDLLTSVPIDPGLTALQTPTFTQPVLEIQYYQVQSGDTLSKIAVLFKVDLDDILRLNEIDDPNSLYAGQVLKIPGSPLPTFTPQPIDMSLETPSATALPATPTPTRTRDLSPGRLVVESVTGAGVLQLERVKIVHVSGGTISLEGWQLVEGSGQVFTFPRLDLFPGAAIYVNTRVGTDSPIDLFWGQSASIWQVDELVIVRDAQGVQRASFVIP